MSVIAARDHGAIAPVLPDSKGIPPFSDPIKNMTAKYSSNISWEICSPDAKVPLFFRKNFLQAIKLLLSHSTRWVSHCVNEFETSIRGPCASFHTFLWIAIIQCENEYKAKSPYQIGKDSVEAFEQRI
jgi:hypothetical protein